MADLLLIPQKAASPIEEVLLVLAFFRKLVPIETQCQPQRYHWAAKTWTLSLSIRPECAFSQNHYRFNQIEHIPDPGGRMRLSLGNVKLAWNRISQMSWQTCGAGSVRHLLVLYNHCLGQHSPLSSTFIARNQYSVALLYCLPSAADPTGPSPSGAMDKPKCE